MPGPQQCCEKRRMLTPANAPWPHSFCEYPQDLVLDLGGRYRIRELQVLSHQSRIASRVRLYVGEGWDLPSAEFRLLGHFSLDSNENSDHTVRWRGLGAAGTARGRWVRPAWSCIALAHRGVLQARELKSVYLDHAASFLRLSVLGCHTNRHNLFNQVSRRACGQCSAAW